jgi:hypothetical protein
MGFGMPKIPQQTPAPQAPSLPSTLSSASRMKFGSGAGSLGGTYITGPTGMNNLPGSTGQSGMKAMTGQ